MGSAVDYRSEQMSQAVSVKVSGSCRDKSSALHLNVARDDFQFTS